ncbi:MAG: hypothetical protein CR982_05750 [Candidatus Cloacimonadota bacterium]|nr:MAG: hypothetical protein CR982_05750 [Candidatus Cloacimonadota bacterium]PIE81375.1 MAG: hypothetical protein CSA15_00620 [Candidatus Delongbacteria bacterium]
MLNERFIGMITSVSAALKSVKLPDGSKIKQGIFKIKLESADIDYKSIASFNPNISATLLNIQPIPFKSVNFGEQLVQNMMVSFFCEEEEDIEEKSAENLIGGESDADFGDIAITNLSVAIKENIPIYTFFLEIPMLYDGKFLFKNLKKKISFEFADMTKKEIREEE